MRSFLEIYCSKVKCFWRKNWNYPHWSSIAVQQKSVPSIHGSYWGSIKSKKLPLSCVRVSKTWSKYRMDIPIVFAEIYESRQSFRHIGYVITTYQNFLTVSQSHAVTWLKSYFFQAPSKGITLLLLSGSIKSKKLPFAYVWVSKTWSKYRMDIPIAFTERYESRQSFRHIDCVIAIYQNLFTVSQS